MDVCKKWTTGDDRGKSFMERPITACQGAFSTTANLGKACFGSAISKCHADLTRKERKIKESVQICWTLLCCVRSFSNWYATSSSRYLLAFAVSRVTACIPIAQFLFGTNNTPLRCFDTCTTIAARIPIWIVRAICNIASKVAFIEQWQAQGIGEKERTIKGRTGCFDFRNTSCEGRRCQHEENNRGEFHCEIEDT